MGSAFSAAGVRQGMYGRLSLALVRENPCKTAGLLAQGVERQTEISF